MIKIGRRGSQNGTLVVTGKQGHVAYPELADNPVRGITTLMGAINAEPLDHGTAHFGPSNLEFTSIDVGNKTVNLIPAEARARFNIRFNDTRTRAELREDDRAPRREGARGNSIRWHIEWEPSNSDVFLTHAGPVRRDGQPGDHRGDRPHAEALDHRRHLRRALHQELLPGDRVRPGRASRCTRSTSTSRPPTSWR